jgi:hypothetical protein
MDANDRVSYVRLEHRYFDVERAKTSAARTTGRNLGLLIQPDIRG